MLYADIEQATLTGDEIRGLVKRTPRGEWFPIDARIRSSIEAVRLRSYREKSALSQAPVQSDSSRSLSGFTKFIDLRKNGFSPKASSLLVISSFCITFIFYAALLHSSISAGAKGVENDPLDGTWLADGNVSFSVGVEMLNHVVASKSYGMAMTRLKCDECLIFLNKVVASVCTPGRKFSLGLCCPAVRAAIDEGKCLCEPRVFQGVIKGQLNFMIQIVRLCRPQFKIPWRLSKIIDRGECKPSIEASTVGALNAQFLGISRIELDARRQQDIPLPSFNDLFEPPESGMYQSGWVKVSIPRTKPSPLSSQDSTPMEFNADIFYPQNGAWQLGQQDPVLANGGPFPVIAFSPGFSSKPEMHLRLLLFLASHGYIVIAQRSTHHLGMDLDRRKFLAWKDDIVTMLSVLLESSKDESSFLYKALDTTRIGISGHSNGGAMSLPAAVDAIEIHGINVTAIVPISPACILLGNECDIPTEYAPKLHGVNVRFIVGTADRTTPPRSAKFFASLLPNDTTAEVVLLKGVTHCVWEAEPSVWAATNSGCGRGSVSPMQAVKAVMIQMEEFLRLHLGPGQRLIA